MKNKPTYVGNIVIVYDRPTIDPRFCIFLGLKPPETAEDRKRKRKIVGCDCWTPPGGARESFDRSHKHAAKRELLEETGWKVTLGSLRRVGMLEGFNASCKKNPEWDDAKLIWRVHIYDTIIPEEECDSYICGAGFVKVSWFPHDKLPFDHMIKSDQLWMPRLFRGEQLHIELLFDYIGNKALKHRITPECFS